MTEAGDALPPQRRNLLRFLPLALFAAVGVVFAIQLASPPGDSLRSRLIGKPAPILDLVNLEDGGAPLTHADFNGVTVINFWASWCGPCQLEHPALIELSKRDDVTVLGIVWHDTPQAAQRYLAREGDPFVKSGVDTNSEAGLRWGVEGVPETFVINAAGVVVYKHAGPILNDDLARKVLPAIELARSGG